MNSALFKTRFGAESGAYDSGVGMSNSALGARLAEELRDRAQYQGVAEAEVMLKSYLNVSASGRVLDTVLYVQVAGKLLGDSSYATVSVLDGGSYSNGDAPTLRGLYTDRLGQLATQVGIESGATHPDHCALQLCKEWGGKPVIWPQPATGGGESGALTALRGTNFEDGTVAGHPVPCRSGTALSDGVARTAVRER